MLHLHSTFPDPTRESPVTNLVLVESSECAPLVRCAFRAGHLHGHLSARPQPRLRSPPVCCPYPTPLLKNSRLAVNSRLLQHPIALLAFNRPLPVLAHQESTRVLL